MSLPLPLRYLTRTFPYTLNIPHFTDSQSIRTFFIKAHVEGSFHLTNSRIFRWLKSQVTRANDILAFGRHKTEDAGLSAIWDDRKADIDQIQTWLMETAETFIVVQGPRGSGKKELVIDQALKDRKVKLVIDCKPIQEARGDSATIYAAAVEVGYRPVFSWMNSMSSLLDLAAQGTIGTKTGFSETLDTQLAKIWQNTTTALKQIALGDRKKDDKDADLDDDTYLEAHPEKRPVVVIDNFLHKSQESSVVYDKISEWAAGLTTANIAHVIFLTNDVSFSKSLSKALPDRVFRQIVLGDCSAEVAKRFVINHLDADYEDDGDGDKKLTPSQQRNDLGQLDGSIEILGGRLTDLEFLARRIKTGETPNSTHFPLKFVLEILLIQSNRSRKRDYRTKRLGNPQNVHSRRFHRPRLDFHPSLAPHQIARHLRHPPLQRAPALRQLQIQRLFRRRRANPASPRASRTHHHRLLERSSALYQTW